MGINGFEWDDGAGTGASGGRVQRWGAQPDRRDGTAGCTRWQGVSIGGGAGLHLWDGGAGGAGDRRSGGSDWAGCNIPDYRSDRGDHGGAGAAAATGSTTEAG